MTHFTERKHLIKWIMRNCTRKSVVRAMDEGGVENLGAFTDLGPDGDSGWIIRVTSTKGKVWCVDVVARSRVKKYSIFIRQDMWGKDMRTGARIILPFTIPWENWDGIEDPLDEIASDSPMPLWDGDNPTEYVRLRDDRRAKITEENRVSLHRES